MHWLLGTRLGWRESSQAKVPIYESRIIKHTHWIGRNKMESKFSLQSLSLQNSYTIIPHSPAASINEEI